MRMLKRIFFIFFMLMICGCSAKLKSYPLINFSTLTLPSEPHYCLVYKEQKSGDPKRLRKAPIYPVALDRLISEWKKMLSQQPRVKLIKENKQQHHFQYVQRSQLFRFPDIIDVQFIKVGPNRTQLFLYSRSVYGYSDMGVNCRRVDHWLSLLNIKP